MLFLQGFQGEYLILAGYQVPYKGKPLGNCNVLFLDLRNPIKPEAAEKPLR